MASEALGAGERAPESIEPETTKLPSRESKPSLRPKSGIKTTSKERLAELTIARAVLRHLDEPDELSGSVLQA